MASNDGFIDYTSEAAVALLKQGTTEIVEQIRLIKELRAATLGAKTPSGSDSAIKNLNTELAKNDALLKQQQQNLTAVAAAQKKATQQTTEEIVNHGILSRQARQMAVIQSTLAGAYQKLSAEQAKSATNVQNIMARGKLATQTQRQFNTELRTAQKEFDALNKRVLAADAAVGRFNRNVGNYPKLASGVRDLVGALGITLGAAGVAALAKSIFDTTKELETMNLALKNVTGSSEEAAEVQAYLAKTAEAYGINIQVLTKSYIGFFASSKNAIESGKISAEEIRDIFGSVSKAAGAMGLSVEQQEGAFLALSQMISKGNVQAEELRGQLSERLPGAFGILAKSMGVTEQQLNKMLKDGKVLAAEVLPAFAKELEKAYGVENLNRVETLNASVTRLGNSWTDFVAALNDGDGLFSSAVVGLIEKLSEAVKGAAILLESNESARAKELKEIRQASLEDEKAYYKSLEKLDEAEIMRKRAQYFAEIKILQDQVTANNQANSAMLFAANNGQYVEGGADAIKANALSTKALNMEIASYNGRIAAGVELLKKNTKATEDNTGAKKTAKLDPYGAVLAARIRYLKEFADADAALYALMKGRRENEIDDLQKLATDETKSFDSRITAYGQMLQAKQELLLFSQTYELKQIEKVRETEIAEAEKALRTGLKQTVNNKQAELQVRDFYAKQIAEINIKYDAETLDKKQETDRQYLAIAEETAKAEVLIRKKQREIIQSTDKVYRDEQIALMKKTADNEALDINVRQSAFQSMIAIRQSELQIERQRALAAANTSEEIDSVRAKYDVLKRELDELAKDDPFTEFAKKSVAALKSITDEITNSFLDDSGLGGYAKFFNGEFDKIMAGFDKMENKQEAFKQKTIYAAVSIMEAFKETYNLISEASQENFDQEYKRLEARKNIEILFAGESDAAREAIEKGYEARKRAIQERELKAQKAIARFNVIINTASATVAALNTTPFYVGIALAAFAAASGALQLAKINQQQIPQYWKGTDNAPAGLAWTQERGREIITDKSGRIKSTGSDKGAQLTKLDKGDKVYTAQQTALMFDNGLNGILNERGISSSTTHVATVDNSEVVNAVRHLTQVVAGQSQDVAVFDRLGMSIFSNKNGQRTQRVGNRLRIQRNG